MGKLEEGQVLVSAEWRRRVDETLDAHMERLDRGDEKFDKLEAAITTNTEITQRVETNTATVVTWVSNVIGFRNVVDWLGSLALKLAAVLGAATILLYTVQSGRLPAEVKASAGSPPKIVMPAGQ